MENVGLAIHAPFALQHPGTGKNAQNRYRDCMLKTTEIQSSSYAPIEISENEIASRLINFRNFKI